SSRTLLRILGEPRLEPWPIGLALDDQVIRVAGEAIDGALGTHGIGEGGKPFVRPSIRRHDNGAGAIAREGQVVEVAALDRVEDVDREVVEDEEIDGHEFPQFGFVAVIEPRMLQRLEQLVGADGEDGGAAPTGNVSEGVREKGLADADGTDDRDVRM